MTLSMVPLYYAYDALEPYISRRALELHHGEHYRSYVDKTLALLRKPPSQASTFYRIAQTSSDVKGLEPLCESAAQAWSHRFFWRSIRPGGGGRPDGALGERIDAEFGSYKTFADQFCWSATEHFDNGWEWLALDHDHLKIVFTSGPCPLPASELTPLLVVDVWEHAYYLDYQNRREDYVSAVLGHLVDWGFANGNFALAGVTPRNWA